VQGRQAGSRQAGRHFSQTSSHLHKSNPEAVAEAVSHPKKKLYNRKIPKNKRKTNKQIEIEKRDIEAEKR